MTSNSDSENFRKQACKWVIQKMPVRPEIRGQRFASPRPVRPTADAANGASREAAT